MISKEFFSALNDLDAQGRISKEKFLEFLEAGIASAYKKENGEARNISIQLNPEKDQIDVIAYQLVVEEVQDPGKEISLEDAQKIKASYKVGDIISEKIPTKEAFSRISALTAKLVVAQKMNDFKKASLNEEMNQKEGEIVTCQIKFIQNGNIYAEIVGTQIQCVMTPNEQINSEVYKVGDRIKAFVKRLPDPNGNNVNQCIGISRLNNGFIRRLFELNVPEIKAGLVEIKRIVRVPGVRTKVVVASKDPSIDPIGACIGAKNARIIEILKEINCIKRPPIQGVNGQRPVSFDEGIDVIPYTEDPIKAIANALTPASVIQVQADPETKKAIVIIKDRNLAKAVGKQGSNAKLASKLTGYKIDIKELKDAESLLGND